jgi:hypothetical protein
MTGTCITLWVGVKVTTSHTGCWFQKTLRLNYCHQLKHVTAAGYVTCFIVCMQIFQFDMTTRELVSILGNGQPGATGDGGLATAATSINPAGLAVASNGAIYFSSQ